VTADTATMATASELRTGRRTTSMTITTIVTVSASKISQKSIMALPKCSIGGPGERNVPRLPVPLSSSFSAADSTDKPRCYHLPIRTHAYSMPDNRRKLDSQDVARVRQKYHLFTQVYRATVENQGAPWKHPAFLSTRAL
jgi:hypothetical protein